MSENDRERRTPRMGDENPGDRENGHDADIGTRRESRVESRAERVEREKPEISRTPRETSQQSDDSPPRETSRTNSNTGPRTTIPGNTSETGVGSPTPDGPASPTLPGRPGAGCSRTAGSFMFLTVVIAAALSRLVRR